jgi:hypothetical protein
MDLTLLGRLIMPYDIKENYRGKSGYSVVGPGGVVSGTHRTRGEAAAQQRALYAAEKKSIKKAEHNLYEQLSPAEKEFHDSLVTLADKYGPLDAEETGIWIGYESAAQNSDASIGVMCGNCSLHYDADDGQLGCMILSYQVEARGKCRLAVIPPGYVNVNKNVWGGRFV